MIIGLVILRWRERPPKRPGGPPGNTVTPPPYPTFHPSCKILRKIKRNRRKRANSRPLQKVGPDSHFPCQRASEKLICKRFKEICLPFSSKIGLKFCLSENTTIFRILLSNNILLSTVYYLLVQVNHTSILRHVWIQWWYIIQCGNQWSRNEQINTWWYRWQVERKRKNKAGYRKKKGRIFELIFDWRKGGRKG